MAVAGVDKQHEFASTVQYMDSDLALNGRPYSYQDQTAAMGCSDSYAGSRSVLKTRRPRSLSELCLLPQRQGWC